MRGKIEFDDVWRVEIKWELKRLKPLQKILDEIKDHKSTFIDDYDGELEIEYKKFDWAINHSMKNKFGKTIKVKRMQDHDYTHTGEDGWLYHELWFEPELEDFLKEEEFKV